MDLPVKLVELLKHTDVDGKKLAWNLQVNTSAVTVLQADLDQGCSNSIE